MKKIIFILTIIFAISLTGCLKKKAVEEGSQATGGGFQVVDKLSLMDWLKKGRGVECSVSDPQGTVTVRAMEGKVRIDGMGVVTVQGETQEQSHSITTEDWMYMWTGKEGTKMNLKRLEELSKDFEEDEAEDEPETWQDMVESWEASDTGYQCQELRLGADVFTPPGDVNFVDWTAMIEGFADIGKQLEQQSEGGTGEIDLKALEEQAAKMQEQFGIEQ